MSLPPPEQVLDVASCQPIFGSSNYLKKGEHIAIVHEGVWCRAILRSHSGHRDVKNGSLYWNYSDPDNKDLRGSYLFPGESWAVLRDSNLNVDLVNTSIILPVEFMQSGENLSVHNLFGDN